MYWGKCSGLMFCGQGEGLIACSCGALRPPMPNYAVHWPVEPGFKISRFLSLRALTPVACRGGLCLHGQGTLSVARGVGMTPSITERICVFTIAITAPQQEHRIGARALTQAIE